MHKSSFIPVVHGGISHGPRDIPRFLQGTIVLGTVVFPCASASLLSHRQCLPPHLSHQHKRLLSTALATGGINCSGSSSLEASRWQQQLGGGAVVAAAWGQQLGSGVLVAAWWRLRQYGSSGSGGGGSSATTRRWGQGWQQLGGGVRVVAAAAGWWLRRKQLGGSSSVAAAAVAAA